MRPLRPDLTATLFVSWLLASPAAARADDEPPVESPSARAERLFNEALGLMDQGRGADACVRFRESLAAEPAVGTMLNVAACSKREGQPLAALAEYERARAMNDKTADAERRRQIGEEIKKALSDLEGSVARVSIAVAPASAAATIRLDGKDAVARQAVLPGRHDVEVSAAGFKAQRRELTLAAGADTVVAIELAPEEAPPGGPAPQPATRPLPLVSGGIAAGVGGAALLGASGVLFALASERAGRVRELCPGAGDPPVCSPVNVDEANAVASEGRGLLAGAYVGLGLGGAAAATGIALLIVGATRHDEPPVAPRVALSTEGGMIGLAGSFR